MKILYSFFWMLSTGFLLNYAQAGETKEIFSARAQKAFIGENENQMARKAVKKTPVEKDKVSPFMGHENKIHVVHRTEAQECQNSKSCFAYEYSMNEKEINGALVTLTARYPDTGYVSNIKCKEMSYVVKGFGKVVIEGKEYALSEGDVIFIDRKEKYFWEGNMTLFVVCTPSWTLKQYKHVP